MKHSATFAIAIDSYAVEDQNVIRLDVTQNNLPDLTLCIQLLRDNLATSIAFEANSASMRVEVVMSVTSENRFAIQKKAKLFDIGLAPIYIEYLQRFLLEFYRDGRAQVDHVDLETKSGDYIKFSVDKSKPPVTPAEAWRRLRE